MVFQGKLRHSSAVKQWIQRALLCAGISVTAMAPQPLAAAGREEAPASGALLLLPLFSDDPAVEPSALDRIQRNVETALRRSRDWKTIQLEAALAAARAEEAPAPVRQALGQAVVEFHRGMKAVEALDPAEAVRAFESARDLAVANALHLQDSRLLTLLLTQLAVLYRQTGRLDLESLTLEDLARLDPQYRADPALMPPDTARNFELMRKTVTSGPAGKLVLDIEPGVRVLLDGRVVGMTPLPVQPVLAAGPFQGKHVLSLEREGYLPIRKALEVVQGQTHRVTDLDWVEDPNAAQVNRLMNLLRERKSRERIRDAAAPVMSRLGVGRMISGRVVMAGDGLALILGQHWGDWRDIREARLVIPLNPDLSDLAARLDADDLNRWVISGQDIIHPAEAPQSVLNCESVFLCVNKKHVKSIGFKDKSEVIAADSPWYKQWWFWTIAGGVLLAGAGTGIGIAMASSDSPPPPAATLELSGAIPRR
ncbi:MAG: hypothetical protein GMKNLPBB_01364 [Myxococcota bacterium]|nr:hypothetical protein [Myxococcota bacterium]